MDYLSLIIGVVIGLIIGLVLAYLIFNRRKRPIIMSGEKIMAKFQLPADQQDFEIQLSATGFTDSEGNPTGAEDIDLVVDVSNENAIDATVRGQSLSEDGKTLTAVLDVHVGAPSNDLGTLSYRAINRDTDEVVAAGSDEFIITAGEAKMGTVTASVPFPPVEEEPPAPAPQG